MEIGEIIRELSQTECLPVAAILAARKRRAELTPLFLAEIGRILLSDSDERSRPTPLFYAVLLFAEWQEARAYRPLVLLRQPAEGVDGLFGVDFIELAP